MREVLVREPNANAEQLLGLSEITNGRNEAALGNKTTAVEHFDTARDHFDTALDYMDSWTHADSADALVQRARIKRDAGFTSTRLGILTTDPRDFLDAHRIITGAVHDTGGYVSGEKQAHFIQRGTNGTPKQQRRELFSEHAATLAVLSRNAIAAEVLRGTLETVRDKDVNTWPRLMGELNSAHMHGWAHQLGGRGTNGYYDVSNSTSNAVQEMARGRRVHAGIALGRALASVSWTLLADSRNFPAAAGNILHHLPGLTSQDAARKLILRRP